MTKLRAPLTIDAALARIAGHLDGGWIKMGQLTERADRTVRNWGDPDTPEQIPVDCAIALDLAYQAEGGDGAPIFEAYSAQLDIAHARRFADRIALLHHAAVVIKEGGEAHAALVKACRPDATVLDRTHALRECSQAFEPLRRAIAMLELPDGQLLPERHATGPPLSPAPA